MVSSYAPEIEKMVEERVYDIRILIIFHLFFIPVIIVIVRIGMQEILQQFMILLMNCFVQI